MNKKTPRLFWETGCFYNGIESVLSWRHLGKFGNS